MNTPKHTILNFVLALITFISTAAWGQSIGRVEFSSGEANIVRGTQTLQATRSTDILQGDTIQTGINGQIQMRMVDNAFLAMRPNSRLTLDQYRAKGDAADGAILSLAYGILRTFTGALVSKDKSKFVMRAQNATVGIRGSGNILSYNDKDGTVNHTLTGAHSVTAKDLQGIDRTLISSPGQTVQVAPGGTPKFIPTPQYIFAAASNSTTGSTTAPAKEGDAPATEPAAAPAASATAAVAQASAPATSATAGATTTQAVTQTIVNTLAAKQFAANDDLGFLTRFTSPFGATGQKIAIFANGGTLGSEASFDINGNLLKISNINSTEFLAGTGGIPVNFVSRMVQPATVAFSAGLATDYFRNADGSIVIGRWQGGQVTVTNSADATVAPIMYQLGNNSASYTIYRALPTGILYSFTGSTSYKVDAATRPTDSFGNVGQLISAYINANFSTRTADMGLQVAINNQNLTLSSAGIPIDGAIQFGNVAAVCTGINCNSNGYRGTVNANFAGANGSAIAASYRINPNRLTGQAYTDMIAGNIAFTALSTPTSFALPLTGSLSLNMNRFVEQNPSTAPSLGTGTINANFSNRTLDFTMNFIDTNPNQSENSTYTGRASAVPIVGVGFAASSNNVALKNDGKVAFTCTGSCRMDPTKITSRFDGYFINAQGNGAIVNIVAAGPGEVAGPNSGLVATAYFGTATSSLSPPAAPNTFASVLQPVAGFPVMSQLMTRGRPCTRCVSP